jgi:FKBP-type peptidyl-prolyl cis-trans isomerase
LPETAADSADSAVEIEATEAKKLDDNNYDDEGPIFHEANGWLLVIGEKDVVPALEMGIRFMRLGETAIIRSHSKYAYGPGQRDWKTSNGKYTLPANALVQYTVTLRNIVPSAELESRSFKLKLCQSKKIIGNDIYNSDHVSSDNPYAKSRALQVYQRSADMLTHLLLHHDGDDSTADEVDSLDTEAAQECLLACMNNIAAVHMRCQSYHAAKEACVAVLERDSTNVKALLRAAQAALLDPASSYEEVDAAIQAASTATKAQQEREKTEQREAQRHSLADEVERLRLDLQRKQRAHAKKERAMWYAKMARSPTATTVMGVNGDNLFPPAPAASTEAEDSGEQPQREPGSKVDRETSLNNGDTVDSDQAATSTNTVRFWPSLSWKRTILPYGLQLIMPFVMYWFFLRMRRDQASAPNDHEEL